MGLVILILLLSKIKSTVIILGKIISLIKTRISRKTKRRVYLIIWKILFWCCLLEIWGIVIWYTKWNPLVSGILIILIRIKSKILFILRRIKSKILIILGRIKTRILIILRRIKTKFLIILGRIKTRILFILGRIKSKILFILRRVKTRILIILRIIKTRILLAKLGGRLLLD